MKKLRVGLYVGGLPTTTFIIRLAKGLARNPNLNVTLYGNWTKPFIKDPELNYSGARNGFREGVIQKHLRYWKFAILLKVFRADDKKMLDGWMRDRNYFNYRVKCLVYPILWDKLDILHIQWAKDLPFFEWLANVNIKLIVSLRGAHVNYSPLADQELANMYTKLFPKVDRFHGVSRAICKEAERYGALSNKCQVVYSGLDLKNFPLPQQNRKYASIADRKLSLVAVGRAHWKKGYHFLLDACKVLIEKKVDFKLNIIGAANDEELLMQQHQLGLINHVQLLPRMEFKEVKDEIRNADILLLPSVEEGIANVVLEAMALGTLVISTNCGGMEEAIEDGKEGWIVPIRNSKAIANKVIEVSKKSESELEATVEAAYKKIERQHNEKLMISNMIELYHFC